MRRIAALAGLAPALLATAAVAHPGAHHHPHAVDPSTVLIGVLAFLAGMAALSLVRRNR